MSQDSSEEPTLPATPRKLQRARRKGQVARSRDVVTAAAVGASLFYLAISLPDAAQRFGAVLRAVGDEVARPFEASLGRVWSLVAAAAWETLLPLLFLVATAAAVAGALVLRGPVLSADPIVPRFDRINPMKGFKRLFRLPQLAELVKSSVKTTLLIALYLGIVWWLADSLVQAPRCGPGCLLDVGAVLFALLAAGVCGIFTLSALFDMPLQRQLFLREMRMTHTERRRERRDVEGDPQIELALRQRRQDLVSNATVLGLRNASLLLVDPAGGCIGLRYVPGETSAPMVVCRAEGDAASSMVTQARLLGIASDVQPELCRALLSQTLRPGSYVPEELFRPAAAALLRAGVI